MFEREKNARTVLEMVWREIEFMYHTPIDFRSDEEWRRRYKELLDQEKLLLEIQRMSIERRISA